MKRIKSIITASFLALFIPFAIVAGQEMKNEKRIKIVIAEDDGSKVILDTLITGNSLNDSLILDNGKTLYLVKEDSDATGGHYSKKYIITSSSPEGGDAKKEIKKEVTIISSDPDLMDESGNESGSNTKCESKESEKVKYVISRDGVVITVEGSDYAKVKDIIKEIGKTLDAKNQEK